MVKKITEPVKKAAAKATEPIKKSAEEASKKAERAVKATEKGLKLLSLTGAEGGELGKIADVLISIWNRESLSKS